MTEKCAGHESAEQGGCRFKKLVIGASGFLGAHVAQQLVREGHTVKVLLRTTSSTRGLDDLDLERSYGDIFDTSAVLEAMRGCDTVFYCAVDTRAWLRNSAPLFRTNVDGLKSVLEVASEARIRRFVFASSIGTIGLSASGPATEETRFNWAKKAGGYIRSRVAAENLVLRYVREYGFSAVILCVANTYGPGDWAPTPHGAVLAASACGRMPVYVAGAAAEVVGIEDAANALVLAAEYGRTGERYIISERFMSAREIYQIAAQEGDKRPPKKIPLTVMYTFGMLSDLIARLLGKNPRLSRTSVRLMHIMSPMDHSKAQRDLGWFPGPTPDAIRSAARFFIQQQRNA